MQLRASVVTAFFAVVFAVIANLAWATAVGTSDPWFSSTINLQVYSTTLLTASLLAVLVAAVASRRVASIDEAMRVLDLRVAAAKDAASAARNPGPEATAREHGLPEDDEVDELLEAIGGFEPMPVVTVERTGHDSLMAKQAPTPVLTSRAGAEVLREIRRQRVRLRAMRTNVWRVVAGPLLASVAFVAIAGAMLPGSAGFAESSYQLNTALILFLGYGWAALVAWAVAGLVMHVGPAKSVEG